MFYRLSRTARQCGFTLLEVMLVVVLVGLMATALVSNLVGPRPDESLKHASDRFVAVFNLASEYALLNNVELGLVVNENSYQFVGFDGVYWRELEDKDEFAKHEIKAPLLITIKLDDLPIEEEPQLISPELFKQEDSLFEQKFDDVEIAERSNDGKTKDGKVKPSKPKVKIVPQVYLLSGGDITPFRVIFSFDETMNNQMRYFVDGQYSLPLVAELNTDDVINYE